jgi:hypothetical protein
MVEILANLTAALGIAAVAAAASALSKRIADRQRKQKEVREAEREQLTTKLSREALLEQLEAVKAKTPVEIGFGDLLLAAEEISAKDLRTENRGVDTAHGRTSREEIRREAEEVVGSLRERLEQVERRFPEESTLEKISSINDAILATKIEQLEKSIENLESRLLTKWDVATIVFAVFAAIGGIAGVIFTVANFVLK